MIQNPKQKKYVRRKYIPKKKLLENFKNLFIFVIQITQLSFYPRYSMPYILY